MCARYLLLRLRLSNGYHIKAIIYLFDGLGMYTFFNTIWFILATIFVPRNMTLTYQCWERLLQGNPSRQWVWCYDRARHYSTLSNYIRYHKNIWSKYQSTHHIGTSIAAKSDSLINLLFLSNFARGHLGHATDTAVQVNQFAKPRRFQKYTNSHWYVH